MRFRQNRRAGRVRRLERAPPVVQPDPLQVGNIEPARPAHLAPRVIYEVSDESPDQIVKILELTCGRPNPMPWLSIWDPQFFCLQNPINILLDHQIWASLLNRAIPYTHENARYLALSCWERRMNAEQTMFNLQALLVQKPRVWPMKIDEVEFWFRRFGRGNEDLEPSRSIEDLMREEAENWEELSKIEMVEPEPYVEYDGGPLNFQTFELNRFDYYIAWMSYGKKMPETDLHRRYAISLAFQHRYTVKRARQFLWGIWGAPADEKYPVETDEIQFWYRRFRMGNFREMDFELRKKFDELKLEEPGWLALGCQRFDWLGCYYLSSESISEIRNDIEKIRIKSKIVFRVSKGVAEPQDRNAPDSYFKQFINRLPSVDHRAITFTRPNRFITDFGFRDPMSRMNP